MPPEHRDNSILLDYLRGKAWRDPQSAKLGHMFEEIPLEKIDQITVPEFGYNTTLMAGDLLPLKIGKCAHHLCLAIDEKRFMHCFSRLGVTEANINDPTYRRRLQTIFRARNVLQVETLASSTVPVRLGL